ncbi:hypothetical protein MTR67_002103 [Solanum verrucosum]|uniref:Uncharacterized protein n=1 Tax=Solanum verrucosum TaxID=315347 RepID=A0AAF0PPT3_SOLVR|nr:hypothetical protein MTR67_002103 [Solanum verrucosum]
MSRSRASISSGRWNAVPESVIETLVRDIGRALARGRARGVAPGIGHSRGAAPAKGRAREASPEPQFEVVEDQFPPEFGAPLFQETLLRLLVDEQCYKRFQKIKSPQFQGGKREKASEFLTLFHEMLEAWTGASSSYPRKVISFSRAQRLADRGCFSYLDFIRDTTVEPPPMDSAPAVQEFSNVIPTNLPGVPPDRDIDFTIDLEPSTKPISISPYCMALAELKELND